MVYVNICISVFDIANRLIMKFKITFRLDQEEYLCTESYNIEALSLLEAAKKADKEIEAPLKGTIISIEREL